MTSDSSKELAIKIAYFTSLAAVSTLIGFSTTIGKARNSSKTPEAKVYEEGVALARRALFRGTAYSVGGFSIFIAFGLGIKAAWTSLRPVKPSHDTVTEIDIK